MLVVAIWNKYDCEAAVDSKDAAIDKDGRGFCAVDNNIDALLTHTELSNGWLMKLWRGWG